MSDFEKRAETLSENGLVDELKKKPSTFNYDAIAVYDRPKTNMVLIQEYIDRFSKDLHLDPITEKVEIVAGSHWEYLYDYTLDAPRLSFEDSMISDSIANLSMLVIGGTQMTIEQPQLGKKTVTKVEWIDPLQTQPLKAVVKLERTDGIVNGSGQVYLDLSESLAIKLEFPGTDTAQSLGGAAIQKKFNELTPEQRRYVLNELAVPQNNDFLVPEKFEIRVHRRTATNTPSSVYESEGAVALFVAMRGNGGDTSIPSDDEAMKYLIPAGRSATILLGHHFLVRKIIAEGLRSAAHGEFEYELDNPTNEAAPVGLITVKKGSRDAGRLDIDNLPHFTSVLVLNLRLALTDASNPNHLLSVAIANEELKLSWKGRQEISTSVIPSDETVSTTMNVVATWHMEKKFKFSVSGGKVVLVGGDTPTALYKVSPGSFADVPKVAEHFDEIARALEGELSILFRSTFDDFIKPSQEIDLFRLHGLLFRSSQDGAVQLASARFPMDLALFGEVAPRLTAFEIDPLETVIGAGGRRQFRANPPQQDISWQVEKVPGHEGGLGLMGADGWYTAPPAESIAGAFTRVRIVATAGGATSSALVKVVTRDVVVNPLVVATATGHASVKLSAGALPGDSVSWHLNTGTAARLEELEDGHYQYIPGKQPISNWPYEIDEVVVTNASTRKTANSYILVKQPTNAGEVPGDVEIDSTVTLPAGQVKLQLMFAQIPVEDEMTWEVRAGSGAIDETGLFTADPTGQHRFAAITASGKYLGALPVHGHIILPIPLVDLDEIKVALS